MTYGQAIRNHAETYGHKVVGKLTRHPEYEQFSSERAFIDEAGNEYYLDLDTHGISAALADGGVY